AVWYWRDRYRRRQRKNVWRRRCLSCRGSDRPRPYRVAEQLDQSVYSPVIAIHCNSKTERVSTLSRGGSEFVDWNSTLVLSFRRNPESRRVSNLNSKTNLDAGVRRHDELLLHLKARNFNHSRETLA